jgi:hypothetical protein
MTRMASAADSDRVPSRVSHGSPVDSEAPALATPDPGR